MRGTLVLVVGPSGGGKDSLIAAARARLSRAERFVFPKRAITRPKDDSEDHIEVDPQTFEARGRDGDFALSWRAHGVAYGIPAAIADMLAAGKHVVVNVSREIVDEARKRFAPSLVIEVTAPAEVRAARLNARGREGAAAITSRLERKREVKPDVVIVNDGPFDTAAAAFLAALSKIENSPPAP